MITQNGKAYLMVDADVNDIKQKARSCAKADPTVKYACHGPSGIRYFQVFYSRRFDSLCSGEYEPDDTSHPSPISLGWLDAPAVQSIGFDWLKVLFWTGYGLLLGSAVHWMLF